MSAHGSRHSILQRLADRITAGEVVFFIGAGFSLDSEGHSGKVLMTRLMVRFEAMCECLVQTGDASAQKLASSLRSGFRETFNLKGTPGPNGTDLFGASLQQDLGVLVPSYFLVNDWMCAAFEELLGELARRVPPSFESALAQAEVLLKARVDVHVPYLLPNPLRIGGFNLPLLLSLHAYGASETGGRPERVIAGKVLFLDTLGFNDDSMMAGAPMDRCLDETVARSAGRLRERHKVLAWLAAEGLCPTLVTTNFDLLLDSAYRLAGFLPANPPAARWELSDQRALEDAQALRMPLNRRYRYFARIADAYQFFGHGEKRQAVQLYKIHGCVEAYRLARDKARADNVGGSALLRALLPSIVFTFREIQNWREDTWSRDFLNTLLRTRTVAFSGYSGADPVIHDTFRTIYEEMARYRQAIHAQPEAVAAPSKHTDGTASPLPLDEVLPRGVVGPDGVQAERAPAFFIGPGREFHGLEILRAASMAIGVQRPTLTEHPNLLSFKFAGKEGQCGFPSLDELYVWLYHLVMRELQARALEAQVHQVYYQLVGRRCPVDEANAVIQALKALRAEEHDTATKFNDAGDEAHVLAVRRRFQRLTDWTWYFHRCLLREYALAEDFLRHPGDSLAIGKVWRLPWYCPASEHSEWATWGVILELALRRLVHESSAAQARLGVNANAKKDARLRACAQALPCVSWLTGSGSRALTIELNSMRRLFPRPRPRALLGCDCLCWELRNETVPWWRHGDSRKPGQTPGALDIWQWVVLPREQWSAPPTAFLEPQKSQA